MYLMQINRRHSLSNAALDTSNAPIFLLDAYTEIFIYYSASCPEGVPYTPPQQCLLWRHVTAMRAQRCALPTLLPLCSAHQLLCRHLQGAIGWDMPASRRSLRLRLSCIRF